MNDYTAWHSYEEAPHTLTAADLEEAFSVIEAAGREPYIEIVSLAEYNRRKAEWKAREVNMSKFQAFVARVKVVLKAAPTYLVAAAVLLPFIANEVTPLLPTEWAETTANVVAKAVAILGAAVAIIRRVTPVAPSERGLL